MLLHKISLRKVRRNASLQGTGGALVTRKLNIDHALGMDMRQSCLCKVLHFQDFCITQDLAFFLDPNVCFCKMMLFSEYPMVYFLCFSLVELDYYDTMFHSDVRVVHGSKANMDQERSTGSVYIQIGKAKQINERYTRRCSVA